MAWSNWESLGGFIGDSTVAVSAEPGRIDLIAPSRDGAHGTQHKWFDNGHWSGWTEMGPPVSTPTTAVARPGGRIDIFNQRLVASSDPQPELWNPGLYHNWRDGSWRGWENIDATPTWGPVVTSSGPDRIDLFDGWPGGPVRHKRFDTDG